ncbi:MAG TPA: hypothetical protein VND95_14580 [Stellaceae bacterium]|nr:hypothetical protein [Stellaceae bacterium]
MDKKIAGLIGAVVGLAAMSSAQAAINPATNPAEGMQASSYADLLAPIANAVALLRADDAARAAEEAPVEVAQYYNPAYPYQYHHHHHHHHRTYRRVYHRRYHHHHHHSAYIGIPGVAGVVVGGH